MTSGTLSHQYHFSLNLFLSTNPYFVVAATPPTARTVGNIFQVDLHQLLLGVIGNHCCYAPLCRIFVSLLTLIHIVLDGNLVGTVWMYLN
jgi:hypothetical protein